MSVPEKQNTDSSESDAASGSEASAVEKNLESIRKFFAEKLGISEEKKEQITILEDVSLKGVADYIKSEKCKNIITMAGAGISTAAGIPDFRTPGTGLYHNLQKYKLPHPQAVFELDFFYKNPKPFFELARELYPGTFNPTISHCFIRLLHEKGLLLRHYTQNIDTLEHVAGVPAEKLVEAHGTFRLGHCVDCRKEYSQDWMKDQIFADKIPTCESCNGVVKPDIVFFGENLPSKFHKCMLADFPKCDLLIILGSSLVVQPFASLVERVPDNCPRLLINREKAGHRTGIMALMGFAGGMDFDGENNTRDVAWLGDCDEGCRLLAEHLGWKDDLEALHRTNSNKPDAEDKEKTEDPETVEETKKDDSKL